MGISRLFIPSRLEDNPYLWRDGNSDYERNLNQLDAVDFRRLRWGDWDIRRTGRVYHAFDDKNIGPHSNDLDYSKVDGYYHSHDFGAVNHVWGLWAKIGDKYYILISEGRVAVGDKPEGPFYKQKKNYNAFGKGCDIYFPRFFHNAPDGPLVNHFYLRSAVFAAPLKDIEVDGEGILRIRQLCP